MLRIETPSKEPQPTHPHTHSHLPACRTATLPFPHPAPSVCCRRHVNPPPEEPGPLGKQAKKSVRPKAPPHPASPTRPRPTDQAVLVAAQRRRADHHPTDRHAGPHVSSGPVLWSARSLSLTGGRLTGRVWGKWVWWRAGARANISRDGSQECAWQDRTRASRLFTARRQQPVRSMQVEYLSSCVFQMLFDHSSTHRAYPICIMP
jgi:hypothetical protein